MRRELQVATLAVCLAGAATAAPKMGQFSIDPGAGYGVVSNADLTDLYGPGVTVPTPAAIAPGIGVLYNVSDAVQLGVRYERVLKTYKVDVLGSGPVTDVQTWNASANAILARARFLIRGPSPDLWFALGGDVGSYALGSATVKDATTVLGSTTTSTADLTGSAVGGELAAEVEKALSPAITVGLAVGYRLAKVAKVTQSANGSSAKVTNADGSDAAIDYSGLNATVVLRFYFGGTGTEVTSE